MNAFRFQLLARDRTTAGRLGLWETPHGEVETPAFMPVGTLATIKGLTPEQVRATGAQQILANTYHLALRPGGEVVATLGGLHRFMHWDGPILTDSGGFQVFSLTKLTRLTDEHVEFRSHIDGSLFVLSPERAIAIQEQLGADCIMCLDECPAADADRETLTTAVRRTTLWAQRCQRAQRRRDQALFGIVQGGIDPDLRARSAKELVALDFPGYAVGGLSVGETPEQMYATLEHTVPFLPEDKPRYLMGVGRPEDLVEAVCRGIDLFDCVLPTRNGRNASAFTSQGPIRLRNLQYRLDDRPIDPECSCPVCRRFSRAYLRHLFLAREMLGPILLSWHNLSYYQQLMRNLREAIQRGMLAEYRAAQLARWQQSV
ncbi:MAG: queuine tRNA-ribosyltransferase [Planctomycetaceae bacterium]|nr:MAG: queuine tRNA-ribosyltransferase [Planctomycetaceae bacterium]